MCSAFTLIEVMVATVTALILGALVLSYIRVSAILLVKNLSTNQSNAELRTALDQMGERVRCALTMPVLIDTSGKEISRLPEGGSIGDSTPAAGVYYDRLLGEPYVVTHPGGSGLEATANRVVIKRSSSLYASPPIPAPGDVLLIESAPVGTRPLVASVSSGSDHGGLQTITVTFASALGSKISWNSAQPKVARLIRREALLVMSNGTRRELRRYPSFEPMPNLNDSKKYRVISSQLGAQGNETTPFTITTADSFGRRVLKLDLRVRVRGSERVLASKEIAEFSGFMRAQTVIPMRMRPKQ